MTQPHKYAFCTSKLAVFQNPSNSSFLVASESLSKQRLAQPHEVLDGRFGVTYSYRKRIYLSLGSKLTPMYMAKNLYLLFYRSCQRRIFLPRFAAASLFFFQFLLRRIRFRVRFRGELDRGGDTRQGDPTLLSSELESVQDSPSELEGTAPPLDSASAIFYPRGYIYAPIRPFWRTGLRKRTCSKTLRGTPRAEFSNLRGALQLER